MASSGTGQTSFIGRGRELEGARSALAEGARLVTLVGPGGIGKTRLALEILATLGEGASGQTRFPGGVLFCELAEAKDQVGLYHALGRALSVRAAGGAPSDLCVRLGFSLWSRGPLLICLDNVEQIHDEVVSALTRWLDQAPRALFLVTSREGLHLEGEAILEVPPLPASEAALLFRQRAGLPNGGPWQEAITTLVNGLDGLPLAIELAAARARLLSPEEVATGLTEPLKLGDRGRRAQQQTLRKTMEWSWELLTEQEQTVLAQCSLFSGGFDLEAAEAVIVLADPDDGGIARLEALEGLRDKSMLRAQLVSGRTRFSQLETIRAFGLEKLAALELEAAARARHAEHFCTRGLALGLGRRGAEGLDLLEVDHENLRDGLTWTLSRGHDDAFLKGLEALLALDPLLRPREPAESHRGLLDLALARPKLLKGVPALEAEARCVRAQLEKRLGDGEGAETDFELARSLARSARRPELQARALTGFGALRYRQGRYDEALTAHRKALGQLEGAAALGLEATIHGDLAAVLHVRGDLEGARRHYQSALERHQEAGDRSGEGRTLARFGFLHQDRGLHEEAEQHYQRALKLHREAEDRSAQGQVLGLIGNLLRERGQLRDARRSYDQALTLLRQAGDHDDEAIFRMDVGILLADHARWDEAKVALRQTLEALEVAPNARCDALAQGYLGVVLTNLGHPEEGEARLEAAEALAAGVGSPVAEVLTLHRGHLELAAGDLLAARRRLERPPPRGARSQQVTLAWRILARALFRLEPPRNALAVAEDGHAFALPGGQWVDLSRRKPLRRLLRALAEGRLDQPDLSLPDDDLLEAGWPGEFIEERAARNRLRVGLTTLRKLGLGELIRREAGGYLIPASIELALVAPDRCS